MSSVAQAIILAAQNAGVDPSLALEVGIAESNLNPNVPDSSAGAIGVMQLMPATAASLGVNPRDPQQNIQGGVTYLAQLLVRYSGDEAKTLAAYNWGPGNVDQAVSLYGANWLNYAPTVTQNYVNRILSALGAQYTAQVSAAAAYTPTTGVLDLTPVQAAGVVPTSTSLPWTEIIIGILVILGLGLVLSEE
jgi:soluble lytic murein transglycosylase-like protein